MRTTAIATTCLAVAALAIPAALAQRKGERAPAGAKTKPDAKGKRAPAGDDSKRKPDPIATLDAETAAITGTVTFAGKHTPAPPARRGDPFCAKTEAVDDSIVVTGGKLRDVHIRVRIPDVTEPPPAPVVIEQTGCNYTPRVVGAVNGQKIRILNGDATLHNVHAYIDNETEFNRAQPKGAAAIEHTADAAGVMTLKCDVHPWMRAYIVVSTHPWFAVTAADGSFRIPGVAPGTYELEAWHPVLGTQTTKVTVDKTGAAQARFEFRAAR